MSSIRVVAVSDLHRQLPVPETCAADLLLLAGDLVPPEIELEVATSRRWMQTTFRDWLNMVPARRVVGITGNHDMWALPHYGGAIEGLRWRYLCDNTAQITFGDESLNVFGSPRTLPVAGFAYESTESVMEQVEVTIPADVDLLLFHGPPRGHGDLIPGSFTRSPGERAGSRAWRQALYRVQPALSVWGHIHESGGETGRLADGGTLWANVAMLGPDYRPQRGPTAFELVHEGGRWRAALA